MHDALPDRITLGGAPRRSQATGLAATDTSLPDLHGVGLSGAAWLLAASVSCA